MPPGSFAGAKPEQRMKININKIGIETGLEGFVFKKRSLRARKQKYRKSKSASGCEMLPKPAEGFFCAGSPANSSGQSLRVRSRRRFRARKPRKARSSQVFGRPAERALIRNSVRADQASEQDIPIGAFGKRNDLLARPPVPSRSLGCCEPCRVCPAGADKGRSRTSP